MTSVKSLAVQWLQRREGARFASSTEKLQPYPQDTHGNVR